MDRGRRPWPSSPPPRTQPDPQTRTPLPVPWPRVNLSMTRGDVLVGERRSALPFARDLLLQAEQRPVVLVHRVHAVAVLEVHPLREERRGQLTSVHGDVTVLDQLLVESRPLAGGVARL